MFGRYVWLYGVLCDPTSVRHCGLEHVVGKGGLNIMEQNVVR